MNKLKLLIIIFIFGVIQFFGEVDLKEVKKLNEQLKKVSDIKKSEIYNQLAKEYWWDKNKEKTFEYGQKALEYSEKFKLDTQKVYALINIGHYYMRVKKNLQSEKTLNKALNIANKIKSDKCIYNVSFKFHYLYNFYDNFDSAIINYKRLIALSKKSNDKIGLSKFTHWLASNYYFNENIDKAFEYYNKAILLYKEVGNIKKVVQLMSYIANFTLKNGNFKKSYSIYKEALKISEKNNFIEKTFRIYVGLGGYYYNLNNFKNQKNFIKKQ